MSYYGDPRYRASRERYDYRPHDDYDDDVYAARRGGYGYGAHLIPRRGGSDESLVEEVERDFPPGEYYYGYSKPRRSATVREGVRRPSSAGAPYPHYDDEYYYHREHRPSRRSRHNGDRYDRHSRHSSRSVSRSPSPRRPRRRKSFSEKAIDAIGGALGVKSGSGHRSPDASPDRDRGRSRRRRHSYSDHSRSPSRSRRAKSEARVAQAVKAALVAGAVEAFRARKEPGPWTGPKGRRVLTAAISAGGVDGLLDRDPDKHGTRHVIESIITGMATNHLVNGPRSSSRGKHGRSRSTSLRDLAATGVLATAGKQIYEHVRSKSRGRDRSHSRDSYDSDHSHGRSRRRSSSVSRALNKGLVALGLDDNDNDTDRDERRHRRRSSRHSDDYSDYSDADSYRSSRRRRRHSRD
ncbi:hypothetical protein VTN31DRAFT_3257 [Thermomyces dupontii]|uniref:uncharacterized protein n=1 Tax=Talaromyces thermophilus TaxID=28565 RepID=UPI003742BC2B